MALNGDLGAALERERADLETRLAHVRALLGAARAGEDAGAPAPRRKRGTAPVRAARKALTQAQKAGISERMKVVWMKRKAEEAGRRDGGA
jgi:hypothetical protein